MFNLNDIRYFLAVADTGSLSGAARQLGVTQPTVGRRITDMEQALGATLFVRSLSGYEMAPAAKEILTAARAIEENAWSITNQVGNESALQRGRVNLTVPEGLGIHWLPNQLPEFRARYPGTHLDVRVHNSFLDLLRRQADIAIRIGKPGSDLLVGRVICEVSVCLFASTAYCQIHGTPRSLSDLKNHKVIAPNGQLADTRQGRELAQLLPDHRFQISTNNISAQLAFTYNSLGISPLPEYLVNNNEQLVKVLPGVCDFKLQIWLVSHRELKDNQHIRNVRTFLMDTLKGEFSANNKSAPQESN